MINSTCQDGGDSGTRPSDDRPRGGPPQENHPAAASTGAKSPPVPAAGPTSAPALPSRNPAKDVTVVETASPVDASAEQSVHQSTRTIESRGPGPSEGQRPLYKIGDYELLAQIATGGMGVVYKARQVSLNRIVAFKTIRDGRLSTDAQIARFRNEAHAAAVLHHSNIVPVYEWGEIEGVHFFSMEFVDGQSLADRIKQGPLDPVVAAGYLKEIARTIAYAHSRGFLHRDLKPSNILIDPAGRPRVTDFGLVKPINTPSDLTGEGAILGTPSYMAPEQSLANCNASPASDVYSLGAILYALLTGRPPFSAENDVDTLIQVRTKEPTAPRSLNAKVPQDLELICLKCLAKEPARRYATADLLADDLECFLAGAPVAARSIRVWERAWLWSRRHPLRAAAIAFVSLLFCGWILTLTTANARLNQLNDNLASANALLVKVGNDKDAAAAQAHELQLAAERHKAKADELLYVSDMQQAGVALRSGDMRRLTSLLERHRPPSQGARFQGGEWDFLWRRSQIAHRPIAHSREAVYFLCLSPNGRFLASAGKDAVIRVYEWPTAELLFSIETHQVEVNGLSFSPDGSTLASAGDDGTIALWEIDWQHFQGGKLLRSIKAHANQVFNVIYAPAPAPASASAPVGRTLISAGRDTVIKLWDAATGQPAGVLEGHRDTAETIVLHPAGKWVASAGHDGDVIVWDIASRTIVRRIVVGGKPRSIDFSHDGRWLAVGTAEHDIRIWQVSTGNLANRIELLDDAQSLAFLPDGQSIAACDYAGTVHICPTGVEKASSAGGATRLDPSPRAWKAHRDQIYSVLVPRDAHELVTAGKDGFVTAWDLNGDTQFQDLHAPQTDIEDVQFIPGSHLLAIAGAKAVSLWDAESLSRLQILGRADVRLPCLNASRDGSTLAVGSLGGVVRLYDLRGAGAGAGGRETRWNLGEKFNIYRIALSPDGRFVAAIDRYNSEKRDDLYVLDARSGKRLEPIRAAACNSAAFSPDGKWLFASGPADAVMVWNVQAQQKVSESPGHVSSINRIEFDPLSRWVATASDDRSIKIWSALDWQLKFTLEGAHRSLDGLAVSPGGRTLASSEPDGLLTLWHAGDEEDLFQPMIEVDFSPAHPERISFSSDGSLVACLLHDPGQSPQERFVRIMKWRQGEALHPGAVGR